MRTIYALVISALLLSPAVARAALDTSGLTDAQVADFNAAMRKTAERNKQAAMRETAERNKQGETAVATDKISEYARIGSEFGKGLAATAKELGVTVNDFAKTPVGRLTTVLIIWKLIGNQLVHITIGLLWLTVLVPLWVYFYRRMAVIREWRVAVVGPADKQKAVRIPVYHDISNDYVNGTRAIMFFFGLLPILLTGVIIIFSF